MHFRRALFVHIAPALLGSILLLSGCESKITAENFELLKKGMTLAEVEAVLGKGELQENTGVSISAGGVAGGAAANSQKTYVWHEPRKEISVVFDADGKMVSKNESGL